MRMGDLSMPTDNGQDGDDFSDWGSSRHEPSTCLRSWRPGTGQTSSPVCRPPLKQSSAHRYTNDHLKTNLSSEGGQIDTNCASDYNSKEEKSSSDNDRSSSLELSTATSQIKAQHAFKILGSCTRVSQNCSSSESAIRSRKSAEENNREVSWTQNSEVTRFCGESPVRQCFRASEPQPTFMNEDEGQNSASRSRFVGSQPSVAKTRPVSTTGFGTTISEQFYYRLDTQRFEHRSEGRTKPRSNDTRQVNQSSAAEPRFMRQSEYLPNFNSKHIRAEAVNQMPQDIKPWATTAQKWNCFRGSSPEREGDLSASLPMLAARKREIIPRRSYSQDIADQNPQHEGNEISESQKSATALIKEPRAFFSQIQDILKRRSWFENQESQSDTADLSYEDEFPDNTDHVHDIQKGDVSKRSEAYRLTSMMSGGLQDEDQDEGGRLLRIDVILYKRVISISTGSRKRSFSCGDYMFSASCEKQLQRSFSLPKIWHDNRAVKWKHRSLRRMRMEWERGRRT